MQDRKPLKTRTYVHEPSLFARENLFYVKLAGEYHRVSDYRIERERMESLLVIYVTEGELTVCLGGKLMTAPAGSIVLLDCRRPHSYFSRQPVSLRWVHIQGNAVFAYAAQLRRRMEKCVIEQPDGLACQAFLGLFGLLQADHYLENSVSVAVHRFLGDLLEELQEKEYRPANHIMRAAAYIRENYMKDISVNDVAELHGMSVYHFIRMFGRQYGMPPHEYLTVQRIACAKKLLLFSNQSVKNIAQTCGYQTAAALNHAFQKQLGLSPSAFHAQQRCQNATFNS